MKLLAAAVLLLALQAEQALCAGNFEIIFAGRRLTQSGSFPIPFRQPRDAANARPPPPPGAVQARPAPEGGSIDDWEFIATGGVKGSTVRVFERIEDPRDALAFAFGEMIYSATRQSSTTTVLTLNSGQQMTIENTGTGISKPGLYHRFKITAMGAGILTAGGENISIVGSQFYILIRGVSSATVEIGWLSVVNPSSFTDVIKKVFEGIVEELVDRFKNVFRGNDCISFGKDSVFRDISGVCNNPDNPFGSAGVKLLRIGEADFADGRSAPGGSSISARKISNIVFQEDSSSDDGSNPLRLTDMFVFFGQFIDHDLGISPVGAFAESPQPLFAISFEQFREELPIPVPQGDPHFSAGEELAFERAVQVRENNQDVVPREIVNEITSFLDLSQVYGSTASRAHALRSFQGGKLKTSGSDFLPFNGKTNGGVGIALTNAPDASTRFYVAGDIRSCENVNLLVLHTIWLREHNKVADELSAALPGYSEEELYQTARAITIAEYQSIMYTEWLPLMLGSDSPSPSSFSYQPGVDASADAFFTTVSFRFGHTMISGKLWRVDSGSMTPSSTASLRDVFFEPEVLTAGNFDSWVRGMAWHEARDADAKVIDDLRSFLFTEDGGPSADLVALNIQRARDMGVPTYNKARAIFGLSQATSFSGLARDAETAAALESAYEGDLSAVDSFAGGLAEKPPGGRLFGDLFHTSIKGQFERFRDGDRFFYKGLGFDPDLLAAYPRLNTILNDGVKMIDILARNSGVTRADLKGRASPFQL